MINIPTHRIATSPGEMLLEEYLKLLNISPVQFSILAGITIDQINAILDGSQMVDQGIAERIAAALGTSSDFWLEVQNIHTLSKNHFPILE